LLSTQIEKQVSQDEGSTFNEIHFIYTLQRMPSFYVSTMIIPIWCIFVLSIFVFYLPTDACEKMTLSISILIGQTVFLTLLAKRIPPTSVEIPLLGGYLLFTMSMEGLKISGF
jgi:nicotinic acetylcholine receptor